MFGRRADEQRRGGAALALAGQLKVESVRDGSTHRLRVAGELELATAHELDEELERVEATDVTWIVVDLGDLDFLDSVGLNILVRAAARSRKEGDRLTLLPGREHIQRVFEISGLASRLPFAGGRPPGSARLRDSF